jgi:hypothetical protein
MLNLTIAKEELQRLVVELTNEIAGVLKERLRGMPFNDQMFIIHLILRTGADSAFACLNEETKAAILAELVADLTKKDDDGTVH